MAESIPSYDELKLRIGRGAKGAYQVVAFGPDGSTASGVFSLPFDETQLDNFVLRVGRPRRGVRAYRSSQMEDAKRFGSQLFDALVTGAVGDVYLGARRVAEQNERGLRVTLYLTDVPELMEVPWEFLYERPSFLSQSIYTPLVRSLDLKTVRPPRKLTLPLRILGLVSRPQGFETLDVDREKQKLEEALSALERDGKVELRWLERATLGELNRAIGAPDDVHVLHFIGHGAYDKRTEGGILVLENAHGGPHEATGEELGSLLQDERSLRLVVLNSCEGARGSHVDPFSGVASSLVEHQIPAVVGMQFEITDEAAITFAEGLYTALAQGFPVDAALAQGRKAIFAAGNDIEFGTPVLFLRAADAQLFDLEQPPVKPEPPLELGEADLALTLHQRPSGSDAGQQINWQLAIENCGSCALRDVAARRADGKAFGDPVELPPGRRHTIRWTEPLDLERRQLITVTAQDPQGSWISDQISATAAVAAPQDQPKGESRVPQRRETPARARQPLRHASVGGSPPLPVHTYTVMHAVEREPPGAVAVAFNSDSSMLATGGNGMMVRLWDVADRRELRALECAVYGGTSGRFVSDIAFSPDGTTLAVGTTHGLVLHDADPDAPRAGGAPLRGTFRGTFQKTDGPFGRVSWATSVAFSPNGHLLATGDYGSRAFVWDAATGALLHEFPLDGGAIARFSPTGQTLATTSDPGGLKLWDVDTGALVSKLSSEERLGDIAFSPDGRFLVAGMRHTVVFDLERGPSVAFDVGETSSKTFSIDGRWLLTGSASGEIRYWDVGTRRLQHTEQHAGKVWKLTFGADGRWLAFGTDQQHAVLWELK